MIAHGQARPRQRKIPLACEPCRDRKSRCDGGKPICSTCHRRALGLERCVYKLDNARTSSTDEYTALTRWFCEVHNRRCELTDYRYIKVFTAASTA
ncbi:hypothetical protein TOPH_09150 [Tolypocladium ophioglossoides CBS 100239]|uniref:Zn(2)-C6 fungal-type domain-containing protein n=1 Tax=Tolypocladium ophioglossoides (strain CBS 100239) TaxID=1163406 RepID=A0A0L0MWI0_TOLOC|nr:hypothetical protein TOPH_09150 [Tolypocladium ophioglossoides CBS 100239]